MKFLLFVVCALSTSANCATPEKEKLYDNFKAYDFTVNSTDTAEKLAAWQEIEGVDFWKFGALGVESRVMIPPEHVKDFEKFLNYENIKFEIRSDNVGEIVERFHRENSRRMESSRRAARARVFVPQPANRPGWDVYWTYSELNEFAHYLAQTYPQFVTRVELAKTFEGRAIYALKVSSGGFGGKPIVFMDAGIHAREWVSPATVGYFLHRLVEDPKVNEELLASVDWIIIPLLNPDGYVYSQTKNRMWRKNRNALNTSCIGVDLNRNFRFSWRPSQAGFCRSDIYSGPAPNSEIETRALINMMSRYRENVALYVAVHSYGNIIAWPWGYAGSPGYTSNWKYHDQVGRIFADAVRVKTGKKYRVGNTAELLGNASGAADDHMHGDQKINLVYTLELSGGGATGFDYPEKDIEALRYETFHGFRAIGLHIANNH